MSNKLIILTKKMHVAYITLNRPEKGNSINLEMARELSDVCLSINQDKEVYMAVITGAGDVFCSGADENPGVSATSLLSLDLSPAAAISGIVLPVIAVLNGDALDQGLEIALACDIRIAVEGAKMGLTQVSKGVLPMDGGTQRLARIAGKGKALEMIITGDLIDARQALKIGLVNNVVDPGLLASEVETIVKAVLSKAPLALRYCKEAVNKGLDLTLEQGLRLEADLYFLLHTSEDRVEGIKSFLQKRQPNFKGN